MARHTTSLHCSPAEPHPPPPADAGRSLRAPADSRCSPAADNGFCSRSSWAEYSPPTKAGHLPARWEERGAAGRRPGWARRPAPPLRNPARPRSASQGSPRGGTAPAERRERVEGPLATPRTPPAAAPWHSTTRRRHRRPTAGAAPRSPAAAATAVQERRGRRERERPGRGGDSLCSASGRQWGRERWVSTASPPRTPAPSSPLTSGLISMGCHAMAQDGGCLRAAPATIPARHSTTCAPLRTAVETLRCGAAHRPIYRGGPAHSAPPRGERAEQRGEDPGPAVRGKC